MALSSQVTNWLYNVIQPQYTNKQVAYSHIYQFLEVHLKKNLKFKIKTSVYISGNGESSLLINLFGSIKLEQTIVPVEIWIPLNYPFSGESPGVPLVYVVPKHEDGLYLKPGNHVDTQGRLYHPYLASWHNECIPGNPEAAKYNLLELINIVHEVVSREVPIRPTLGIQERSVQSPRSNGNGNDNGNGPLNSPLPTGPIMAQQDTSSIGNNSEFPPKPAKIPLSNPQSNQGPPIPQKPEKIPTQQYNSPPNVQNNIPIPLKYQAPLPLPNELNNSFPGTPIQSPSPRSTQVQHTGQSEVGRQYPEPQQPPYQPTYQSRQLQRPQYQQQHLSNSRHDPILQASPTSRGSAGSSQQVKAKQIPVDLMDSADQIILSPTSTGIESDAIGNTLVSTVSQYVSDPTADSPFSSLRVAVGSQNKVNALQTQLTHHFHQASANSAHLDDHITYLTQQLESITNLNRELVKLDSTNSSNVDKVTTIDSTLPLDDLIIPDSVLVNQLYNVVSEIKSIKDTISLVSGTFHSQSELINDARLDLCVKTVRNLGRELFWLELTKLNIANIMSLTT